MTEDKFSPTHLTKDHVVWAYRLMLDRDPESNTVVQGALDTVTSTEDLRRHFMMSPEFRNKNPDLALGTLERHAVITELDNSLRLFVDLSDRVIGVNVIRKCYEQPEIQFVRQTVKAGQNVVDIGANIGFFTINLASFVGGNGKVYAFEPFSQNSDLLVRSISENRFDDRVVVERAVVGDRAGTANLIFLRLEDGAFNSGGAHIQSAGQAVPAVHGVVEVPMIALDAYPLRRPVHFIKIDVEGAEPLAFRGAKRILRDDRPVILSEIHPTQLRNVSKCTPTQLLEEMREMGYTCRLLENGAPSSVVEQIDDDVIRSVVFAPKS